MSNRERALKLLDSVPDYKIEYVIAYLEGLTADLEDDVPNDDTLAAMDELENGDGEPFTGSTEDFISQLLKD